MSALPRIDDGGGSGPELLERAVAYTRGALAEVDAVDLARPTPCREWNLGELLAHMEDSLDAFTEGATGVVELEPRTPTALDERLTALREKACSLLGAWTHTPATQVYVGGRPVPVAMISRVAAIEIAVHGWDVGQATGLGIGIPDDLATELLPTAATVVRAQEGQFAAPVPTPYDARPADRLLALLGRTPASRRSPGVR